MLRLIVSQYSHFLRCSLDSSNYLANFTNERANRSGVSIHHGKVLSGVLVCIWGLVFSLIGSAAAEVPTFSNPPFQSPLLSQVHGQTMNSDGNSTEDSATDIDFARDILPIFEEHCIACHGPSRQESNLRLDLRESAIGTADWGEPVIEPGKSADSLLIQFLTGEGDLLMPPTGSGEPLQPNQVELLRRWIDEGAVWPDEYAGTEGSKLESDHWAFQPLVCVPPPDLAAPEHFPFHNEIDRYILAELSAQQLTPSIPADPATLIRRLYLDLHGLMPTPEQVDKFAADPSRENYERLVDEALASPRYGERWARHWLDVVRFGESTGFEVNRDRANAYYYRDYVIDALNRDLSYRDFVKQQLAGDALGADEATGFLVGGPHDIVKSPDINLTLMQREDELADFVNTTSTAFLGLTVACARCHNHKFDPILQRDYFAMQAVFAGVIHGERPLQSRMQGELATSIAEVRAAVNDTEARLQQFRSQLPDQPIDQNRLPPVNARQNVDEFEPIKAQFVRFSIHRTNFFEPCLDELEIFGTNSATESDVAPGAGGAIRTDDAKNEAEPSEAINLALASHGSTVLSSGNYEGNPKHQLIHLNDGIYGNDKSWIANGPTGWVQVNLPEPSKIQRVVWGRDRQGHFQDRLAVGYSIEVSMDGEQWQEVSSSQRRQPYVGENGQPLEGAFVESLTGDMRTAAEQILEELRHQRERLKQLETQIPTAYVGQFQQAVPIRRLHRGDPLSPREEVPPDTLTLLGQLGLTGDTPEQQRRLKFAEWLVTDDNPLTARVIVNRVWHYHFGRGLVWTTSDFGLNGDTPSHPELLDWLTDQFIKKGWSLKWLHRQILTSSTFRQSSQPRSAAMAIDAESRMLWRFPPRRLEAEAIRDSVLQATGKLDLTMGGPGFLLFKIDRENVHHYFPLEKFQPEHFRRMIYMTKIRQEQDDVFGQFDCPDGSQTMPNRNRSTTALQALNLLNSPFMIQQANFFADHLQSQAEASPVHQVELAYQILFSRRPEADELQDAIRFIQQHGLPAFCRAMLNANEFLYLS